MQAQKEIRLAFYGDDFTGSTDALESLCQAGAKAVLFLEPPTPKQLANYPDIDAFGVAGKTRSLPPEQMEQVLLPAFRQLKESGAKQVHYKVCSTFDSSPAVGSIGKAIDCGATVFENAFVPVVGGTPHLGRYCVFGNLFARMGIGSAGKIHRLDRHPSMSRHPVTPAGESDLRLHLSSQTDKQIALIDVLQLEQPVDSWRGAFGQEEVVLVDALYDEQLAAIGQWLSEQYNGKAPLFSVGGSAVGRALNRYWNGQRLIEPLTKWPHPGKVEPLLVVSGSCSPVTVAQIQWAKQNGFTEVILDAAKICASDEVEAGVLHRVNKLLQQHKNVVVHTGDKQTNNLPSEELGTALGKIAKNAAETSGIKRVVIAGGDTSSYAGRAMCIEAVEMIAPVVIGAPLCKAISANKTIDRLEVNFKGGQVGSEDYFGKLRDGG